jgi:signal transduction histidine kinase
MSARSSLQAKAGLTLFALVVISFNIGGWLVYREFSAQLSYLERSLEDRLEGLAGHFADRWAVHRLAYPENGTQTDQLLAAFAAEHELEGVMLLDLDQETLAAWPEVPPGEEDAFVLLEQVEMVAAELGQLNSGPLTELSGHLFKNCYAPLVDEEGAVELILRLSLGADELEPLARARRRLLRPWLFLGLLSVLSALGVVSYVFVLAGRQQRLERELSARERLSFFGELSAGLAHQLRNPLSTIQGNARLLVESVRGKEAKEMAQDILAEGRRLENLTDRFLKIARVGRPKLIPTNIARVAADAAASLASDAVKISWGQVAAEQEVLANPELLRELLLNLFANAIEASQPGQEVWLEARHTKQTNYLSLEVHDRGRGMDSAARALAVEPFHTTRPDGSGLGLALARRLAELMEGELSLRSRKGKGTIVSVVLRRASGILHGA